LLKFNSLVRMDIFVTSEWTIRMGLCIFYVFFNSWWYPVEVCCASDGVACISLPFFSPATDFDTGIRSGHYVRAAESDNRLLVVQTKAVAVRLLWCQCDTLFLVRGVCLLDLIFVQSSCESYLLL